MAWCNYLKSCIALCSNIISKNIYFGQYVVTYRFLTFASHFINVNYKVVEESKETAEGKSDLIVFSVTFQVVVFIWSTISCWKPFVSIFLTFENLVLCFGHYIFSRISCCKWYVIFCFYQKMIFLCNVIVCFGLPDFFDLSRVSLSWNYSSKVFR